MHVHALRRSAAVMKRYLLTLHVYRYGERSGGGVRHRKTGNTHSRCPRTPRPVFGGEDGWGVGRRNERKIYKRKVWAARSRCLLPYCGCVHRVTINYMYTDNLYTHVVYVTAIIIRIIIVIVEFGGGGGGRELKGARRQD